MFQGHKMRGENLAYFMLSILQDAILEIDRSGSVSKCVRPLDPAANSASHR